MHLKQRTHYKWIEFSQKYFSTTFLNSRQRICFISSCSTFLTASWNEWEILSILFSQYFDKVQWTRFFTISHIYYNIESKSIFEFFLITILWNLLILSTSHTERNNDTVRTLPQFWFIKLNKFGKSLDHKCYVDTFTYHMILPKILWIRIVLNLKCLDH